MQKLTEDWVVGFVEGEGSFTNYSHIYRHKKDGKVTRTRYARFEIVNTDQDILEQIKEFFGFGSICNHINSNDGFTHQKAFQYSVCSRPSCIKLVQFFEGRLKTITKQKQFDNWKQRYVNAEHVEVEQF